MGHKALRKSLIFTYYAHAYVEISDFLKALCPTARSRYLEKLSTQGLEDPYASSNLDKFVDDMQSPAIALSTLVLYTNALQIATQ